MKLTLDQIKSITFGCTEITDDGLLRRFTTAQQEPFQHHAGFYFRTCCAAGAALDFVTDADFLLLTVEGDRQLGQSLLDFDLLVDGVLVQNAACARTGEPAKTGKIVPYGPETFRFYLPEGEKRVTVQMTWNGSVRILNMELPDGASLRPWQYDKTLVAFGDSITQGAYAKHPSMSYITQTARNLNAKLYNFGVGGTGYNGKMLIPGSYPQADIVTISYGTNDFGQQNPESFTWNVQETFRRLDAEFPTAEIFVILPLWRMSESQRKTGELGTMQDVRDRIAEEAKKFPRFTVLDGSKWVPHLKDCYLDSGALHPNDLGMTHYAMGLTTAILEKLG